MHEGDLWPALRGYWHPVALSEELSDRPLAVRLLGERLAVCRLNGEAAVFRDLCIHRGTPISLGWVEGGRLVCAYHGWSYDGAGRCARIPSVPAGRPIPKKARLTAYPAQERHGMVWVCLSEAPRAEIPEFPMLEDDRFTQVIRDKRTWNCTAARAVENFLDIAHLPWIHHGILADRAKPRTPPIHLKRKGDRLSFSVENAPDRTHAVSYERVYEFQRPFSVHHAKREPDGKSEIIVFVVSPTSERACTRFTFIGRNFEAPAGGSNIEDFEEEIIEQDRVIVENQRPEELPLDLAEELHVKGPDGPALEYRRMMRELGVE